MSFDLILKPSCGGCGKTTDLYGSNCKHLTLCSTCGKTMAENRGKCFECGATLTRLIREYNVKACNSNDKNYFIGRFPSGVPKFKKSAENKWSLQKEGLQNRQVTDTLREKFKNRPWLLEDETGQSQYHGHLEGAQSATYYLLVLQGPQSKEFDAIPAGSWYNFNKVAQYKQLTLEEAEEKMKNRRKTADGYERWMMKAANSGQAFAHVSNDESEVIVGAGAGGRGRKKSADEDEGNASDKGEVDEEEEAERKARLGLNKKSGDDEEDEGPGDRDDDDDDIEKGDDWEHEEIFTDDDEAVGNDPEEREDLFAPEIPAPPEIKEEDVEDEADEAEGGLSQSGKELKKLLGKANGLSESEADDERKKEKEKEKEEEEDDDYMDDEDRPSPVLTSKLKDAKEEPADSSSAKAALGGPSRGTPSSKSTSTKGKRKSGEDSKPSSSAPTKKVKTENELKSAAKDDGSRGGGASRVAPPSVKTEASSSTQGPVKAESSANQGPVSEEEIRAVLLQRAPLTAQDLVGRFKARLKCKADKDAFAEILKRISKIQKTNGLNYVVLRGK